MCQPGLKSRDAAQLMAKKEVRLPWAATVGLDIYAIAKKYKYISEARCNCKKKQ